MKNCVNFLVLASATLVFALTGAAQNTSSAGISVTPNHARDVSQGARSTVAPTIPSVQLSEPDNAPPPVDPDEGHHRLGKKFWISWGVAIAASVADVELTAHCIQLPNCQEQNPLVGTHPSRLKLYGIKGAVDGAGFIMSYKWRREDGDADKDWLVPPVGLAAIFGVTDALDARVYVRDLQTAARPATSTVAPARSFEPVLGRTQFPLRPPIQLRPSAGHAGLPVAPQQQLILFPKTAFINSNKGLLKPKT